MVLMMQIFLPFILGADCSYDELLFEHWNEFHVDYEPFFKNVEPECDVLTLICAIWTLLLMLFLPMILLLFYLI